MRGVESRLGGAQAAPPAAKRRIPAEQCRQQLEARGGCQHEAAVEGVGGAQVPGGCERKASCVLGCMWQLSALAGCKLLD